MNKKINFAVYEQMLEFFEAAQQLALAALIETPEDEEAAGIPGALKWAQSMKSDWDKANLIKLLVRVHQPNQNTHSGFIEAPLEAAFPDLRTLVAYEAWERFCTEIRKGQHLDLLEGGRILTDPEEAHKILRAYGLCYPYSEQVALFTVEDVQETLRRVGAQAYTAKLDFLAGDGEM